MEKGINTNKTVRWILLSFWLVIIEMLFLWLGTLMPCEARRRGFPSKLKGSGVCSQTLGSWNTGMWLSLSWDLGLPVTVPSPNLGFCTESTNPLEHCGGNKNSQAPVTTGASVLNSNNSAEHIQWSCHKGQFSNQTKHMMWWWQCSWLPGCLYTLLVFSSSVFHPSHWFLKLPGILPIISFLLH